MELNDARAEVARLLSADLNDLTNDGELSVVPPSAIMAWDLPEPDRIALRRYGLPPRRSDGLMVVSGVSDRSPAPIAISDRARLYPIGTYGTATIAARSGEGDVVAVPRYSEADIHPQLRNMNSGAIAITAVNSSISILVDLAWRYYSLVPILADQLTRAGERETEAWANAASADERAALPDFYLPAKALCGVVADHFAAADPTVITGPEAFWYTAVMEE